MRRVTGTCRTSSPSNGVEVVASLPYYLEEMTDRQRGPGVFAASIEALKRLNSVGYGEDGGDLTLSLIYNPCGAFLPPTQKIIEADFRRELKKRYNINFTELFTITNMPMGRFANFLHDSGNKERYQKHLHNSYNPEAARNVMCKEIISVGFDGALYDCDFNQMLGLKCGYGVPDHIRDFEMGKTRPKKDSNGAPLLRLHRRTRLKLHRGRSLTPDQDDPPPPYFTTFKSRTRSLYNLKKRVIL